MAKRENDSFSVKELMQHFIEAHNLKKGIQKLEIEEAWNQLMGPGVSSYTESVQIQHKTLIVRLRSSVLREELTYGKEKIIKMLNEAMGEELITKLILS